MNAYFLVRASGLDEQTVQRLAKSATQQPATVLFFDTNVLFSLLGLHENPADEGSLALMSLVQKLSTSVPIKLRVLIPTLDEMKRAITASQEAVIAAPQHGGHCRNQRNNREVPSPLGWTWHDGIASRLLRAVSKTFTHNTARQWR
jgi:hypothetical protein